MLCSLLERSPNYTIRGLLVPFGIDGSSMLNIRTGIAVTFSKPSEPCTKPEFVYLCKMPNWRLS